MEFGKKRIKFSYSGSFSTVSHSPYAEVEALLVACVRVGGPISGTGSDGSSVTSGF